MRLTTPQCEQGTKEVQQSKARGRLSFNLKGVQRRTACEHALRLNGGCKQAKGEATYPASSMTYSKLIMRATASATLPLSRCITKLLMDAKIRRPSRTAATIVAKLSSARTMSATPLVTSEPVMPVDCGDHGGGWWLVDGSDT